jgi:pimeloyl-ACP methyl ester carboxylesterase
MPASTKILRPTSRWASHGPRGDARRLGGKVSERAATTAAWRTKRSWFVVARNDRMIDPSLERALARKMRAQTTMLDTSHASMLVEPAEVAAVILAAASSGAGA